MYNKYMNVKKRLKEVADSEYREFSSKLIPNINNILGVRLPVLRKIAKEIYKSGDFGMFLSSKNFKYMEEYMLKGMLIGCLDEEVDKIIEHVANFVPEIDNWSVCDSFCCSLKFTKNNLKHVFDFISKYFKSDKEYEIRFAYVMLLNYYVIDEYIDRVLCLIDEFCDERYYSRMAVSWLVSVCYVNYPEKTEEYLNKSQLDNWTYNKSIQKICESLKVDKVRKERIKQLKNHEKHAKIR